MQKDPLPRHNGPMDTSAPRRLVVALDFMGTLSTLRFAQRQDFFRHIQKTFAQVPPSLVVATTDVSGVRMTSGILGEMPFVRDEIFNAHPELQALIECQVWGLEMPRSLFKSRDPQAFAQQHQGAQVIVVDDFESQGKRKGEALSEWLGSGAFHPRNIMVFGRTGPKGVLEGMNALLPKLFPS